MSRPRKFYKTNIQVVVISEEPYEPDTLGQIHFDVVEGECSGEWYIIDSKELTGKEAADALMAQGSDPGFLMLNEDGTDQAEDGL